MRVERFAIASLSFFAVVAAVFLYRHDPSAHAYYPRCVFHALTGLQCPGCGGTRALYELLHGHVAAAIRFNALFVVSSPILLPATIAEARAIWNGRNTNLVRYPWAGWSVVVIVIAWFVVRNL